jgi:hypothetical protein
MTFHDQSQTANLFRNLMVSCSNSMGHRTDSPEYELFISHCRMFYRHLFPLIPRADQANVPYNTIHFILSRLAESEFKNEREAATKLLDWIHMKDITEETPEAYRKCNKRHDAVKHLMEGWSLAMAPYKTLSHDQAIGKAVQKLMAAIRQGGVTPGVRAHIKALNELVEVVDKNHSGKSARV